MRLVARGDADAFDELYRRNAPWLAVRLRRRCPDDGIVAEVLQDTFVTVWRAAGSFSDLHPRGSAAGWLWTIAARRLVDALRRQARRPEVPTDDLPAVSTPAAEDEALSATVGHEVGAALSRLAPELQDVIRSMVLDGLTVRETSILLGVPEGTVKRRARQARQSLREALG
nr:sigma-70 family RNA polymerase sigma factor [Kineosporia babensis]